MSCRSKQQVVWCSRKRANSMCTAAGCVVVDDLGSGMPRCVPVLRFSLCLVSGQRVAAFSVCASVCLCVSRSRSRSNPRVQPWNQWEGASAYLSSTQPHFPKLLSSGTIACACITKGRPNVSLSGG